MQYRITQDIMRDLVAGLKRHSVARVARLSECHENTVRAIRDGTNNNPTVQTVDTLWSAVLFLDRRSSNVP